MDVIKIKQMLLDGFGVENRFVACNGMCIIDMWTQKHKQLVILSKINKAYFLFCYDGVYKHIVIQIPLVQR